MANPLEVTCLAGQWTKVATNVTSGSISKKVVSSSRFLQTYKMTGQAAPTLISDGVAFDDPSETILASSAIDVYIWVVGKDGVVRVDL